MKTLIAIDGAGDYNESVEAYDDRYWDSWVRRVHSRAIGRSQYFQAARIITGSMFSRADDVARWVQANTANDEELTFVGYSRGAATCLLAANAVKSSSWFGGRSISSIGLFDAVANDASVESICRSMPQLGSTSVFHARRRDDHWNPVFPSLEIGCAGLAQHDFAGDHADLGGAGSDTSIAAYDWICSKLILFGAIR